LTRVAVDQHDTDAVVAATAGVETLYWVDPTTGSSDPLADYERATVSVVRAMYENGVARTVSRSSGGAEIPTSNPSSTRCAPARSRCGSRHATSPWSP
jgi:uncharacterized protein YbjT (DUF2867 family)